MAKLAPSDLAQVLSKLPKQTSENIIVGFENSDDAGVFRLDEERALVQTVDFFTPIVDDPEIYGQVAAINSLNDVYAMGGTPITALSIVCYPQKGDWEILGKILLGGQKAMNAENVVVLGGHSVDDQEIKFGYSVTGIVDINKVMPNSGSQPGDVLVLTKRIGTGVISTGIKFGKADQRSVDSLLENLTTSARAASQAMQEVGANGCTDVTGFGLLGHAFEMAKASKVTFKLKAKDIPLLPGVLDLIEQKMLTRGDKNNRIYVGETIRFSDRVSKQTQSALFDPQTAGGLLISIPESKVEMLRSKLDESWIIGEVDGYGEHLIEVS
ncbi:MAG: selenide, water dikinase SelD [Pyrinomonadaceae bacterium]|nr:selenide, water dikinase SelD [Pyrinomonadaceae bacterium]